MANTSSVTAKAGLSFCNKIIDSIVGPDLEISDALTAEQELELTSLNKSQIYLTFGRQRSWNLYETDKHYVTSSLAAVVANSNTVVLTSNSNSEINVGDTLYFKNQGLPAAFIGGANVLSISANGTVITMNANASLTIANAIVIRSTTGYSDTNSPPAPTAPGAAGLYIWDNVIGGKLLTGNDLCVVAKQWQWTSGTVYSKYDPLNADLFTKPFYILTSDNSVYKCLDNMNDSPSTVEPNFVPTNDWTTPVQTSDGYVWKYMFTLSGSDINKFLALGYIPVRFLTTSSSEPIDQWSVQQAAVDGAIDNIIVVNSGSGYVLPADGILQIDILGGGGTGATVTPGQIDSDGHIVTILVTNGGEGYGANVTRSFTSTANSNVLTHSGTTISNTYINSSIVGSTIPANTYVTNIDNVSNPKKVYLSANATSNGAVGGGVIVGIPRVVATGGGGSGLLASAIVVSNAVSSISVTNAGLGYVPPILISAHGTGTGATFSIDSDQVGLNGEILGVNVDTPGQGYSNVRMSISGGFGSGAELKVMPGPHGGHGSNPQEELGARSLMISVSLNGTESGNLLMTLGNEFRQVALIENPLDANTGNVMSTSVFFQPAQIFVTPGLTDFVNDEVVYQGSDPANATFSGVVEAFDSANNLLFLNNTMYGNNSTAPSGDLPLQGVISGTNRDFVSQIAQTATKYTGKVLFIQNINPIVRANNQNESIKIVINE
jgi:hypothetical protein